jgi:methyl-accepting chemotaxis protein
MDGFEDLKKRIDHLQYDEINPIKEDINEIKITLTSNDLLVKQALESNKKVSDSLEVLKDTMVEVSRSVRDSNRINDEITKTIEELNKRICSVDESTNNTLKAFGKKIEEIDNKSKLDIMLWLKNNWFGIIGILGIIYTIIKNTI